MSKTPIHAVRPSLDKIKKTQDSVAYTNPSFAPEIVEYVEPTPEELRARGKRNVAIALGLAGFMFLVFCMMLLQSGFFG